MDCVDASIHLLSSSSRNVCTLIHSLFLLFPLLYFLQSILSSHSQVRKLAERLLRDILHRNGSIMIVRVACSVIQEASPSTIASLRLPMKFLREINPRLAVTYGTTLIAYAFGGKLDLQDQLSKLEAVTVLAADLQNKKSTQQFASFATDILYEADVCYILFCYLSHHSCHLYLYLYLYYASFMATK